MLQASIRKSLGLHHGQLTVLCRQCYGAQYIGDGGDGVEEEGGSRTRET